MGKRTKTQAVESWVALLEMDLAGVHVTPGQLISHGVTSELSPGCGRTHHAYYAAVEVPVCCSAAGCSERFVDERARLRHVERVHNAGPVQQHPDPGYQPRDATWAGWLGEAQQQFEAARAELEAARAAESEAERALRRAARGGKASEIIDATAEADRARDAAAAAQGRLGDALRECRIRRTGPLDPAKGVAVIH